jgi:hypothetical protein
LSALYLNSGKLNSPFVPPLASTKFGHRSLGDRESNSASGDPVELTVITVPKVAAELPKNPRTKFWAAYTTRGYKFAQLIKGVPAAYRSGYLWSSAELRRLQHWTDLVLNW